MSVIDAQIQSRGVMTAEDLYDFLQSDAEKTVDIDAETGKITAVSEGITKPRIAVCPDSAVGFSGSFQKTPDMRSASNGYI